MGDKAYEDVGKGAYFYDFYFDKNGYLFKTEGIEGIMIDTIEHLYWLHSQYHKALSEPDYVPVGSIIGCTYGSILARLSGSMASGVYVGNGAPVMTCADCETGVNIPTFGTCNCPEIFRRWSPGRRKGTYGSTVGPSGEAFRPSGYKCIPLIAESWKQPGKDRVLIWRPADGGSYQYALKDNAVLVCLYGGTIGVVEPGRGQTDQKEAVDRYYVRERIKVREGPNGKPIQVRKNTDDGPKYEDKAFEKGTIVEIRQPEETKIVEGSDHIWIKTYYGNDQIGWIAREFLEELPQPVKGHVFRYDWERYGQVDQKFKDKAAGVAKALGIDPDDLMAVMAFESYFGPSQKNMGGSPAIGLIQFTPDTAAELNTSLEKLEKMSGVEQLDYVFGYLYFDKENLKDLGDIYMRVFCPEAVGMGEGYVLYSEGEPYNQNKGLDKDGHDGISKKEAVQAVIDRRKEYE